MFIFYFDPVANTSIAEMWAAIPCWIDVLEVCNLSHILKPKRLVFLIITTYKRLCNSFKFVSCHNMVVLCSGQIMVAIISSRLIIVTSTKVLAKKCSRCYLWNLSTYQLAPSLVPRPFPHTVCDQKLEAETAWERGYWNLPAWSRVGAYLSNLRPYIGN